MLGDPVLALINCPECGNRVSDLAAACPRCGCPAPQLNKESPHVGSSSSDGHSICLMLWWLPNLIFALSILLSRRDSGTPWLEGHGAGMRSMGFMFAGFTCFARRHNRHASPGATPMAKHITLCCWITYCINCDNGVNSRYIYVSIIKLWSRGQGRSRGQGGAGVRRCYLFLDGGGRAGPARAAPARRPPSLRSRRRSEKPVLRIPGAGEPGRPVVRRPAGPGPRAPRSGPAEAIRSGRRASPRQARGRRRDRSGSWIRRHDEKTRTCSAEPASAALAREWAGEPFDPHPSRLRRACEEGVSADRHDERESSQFSTRRPGTRSKSRRLAERRRESLTKAVAAIFRSIVPR